MSYLGGRTIYIDSDGNEHFDYERDYEPKPITNDDLINAMSVEEKAEWLSQFDCSAGCKARRDACGYGNNCYKAWIDWLKKEADDGIL